MKTLSKHDAAWQRVFEQSNLLQQIQVQGYAYISAEQLKAVGRREPRLMAKQDTLSARPAIFKEHNLTIFPVENGQYVIFQDPDQKSYFCFDASLDELLPQQYISKLDLKTFETYPVNQHLSESQAIDFAFVSSLLQHFLGDDLIYLTIRGRLRSGAFYFTLPNRQRQIQVAGVQIEVDAGYESRERIYLLEAKVGKREDFHIRQLLYPYLEWSQRSRKEVIPIFLIYSNGQYYLLQFCINPMFGEFTVVKQQCYTVNESPRATINFLRLLQDVPVETEPAVPYPQANDLDKVVDIIHLIETGIMTKSEISTYFDFDERQGDYYLNAAAYLRFVARDQQQFGLTPAGEQFCHTKSRAERTKFILLQMVKTPTFREIFQLIFNNLSTPGLFEDYYAFEKITNGQITQILRRYTPLNMVTASRRASTVRSWLRWVFKNSAILIQ